MAAIGAVVGGVVGIAAVAALHLLGVDVPLVAVYLACASSCLAIAVVQSVRRGDCLLAPAE